MAKRIAFALRDVTRQIQRPVNACGGAKAETSTGFRWLFYQFSYRPSI